MWLIVALIMALTPINLNALDLFAAQYLSHFMTQDVASFQRDWTTALVNPSRQTTEDRYLYFEAMRGGAKTTWCSVINGVYQAVESPNPELQIISQSGGINGLSTKVMRLIRRELDGNLLLRHDYQYKHGESWTNEHIQIVRADGSTFDLFSRGKRGSVRGARGDVLIDDPQDKEDCRSETVLRADEEWLFTDVLPVLLPHNRLIFVATPISPISLASKVKQLPGFKILSAPLEDPIGSGKSSWPGQYPDSFIYERKGMMGIEYFNSEYNCQPTISGNPVFRAEWFKHYDPESAVFLEERQRGFFTATGVDCAESQSTQADRTAIVSSSVDWRGGDNAPIYVTDVWADRQPSAVGAAHIIGVFDRLHQHKTIVESRVTAEHGGDAMIKEIEKLEQMHGVNVNLRPLKVTTDKVTRALRVQGACMAGRVYLNKRDKMHQELLTELTMFTGDQNFHDDLVDAFCMSVEVLLNRGVVDSKSAGPTIVLPPGHRSTVTGRV